MNHAISLFLARLLRAILEMAKTVVPYSNNTISGTLSARFENSFIDFFSRTRKGSF
jgi:hypothetical protein